MILLQYFLTFCIAVARPEVGLIILTFALASVGTTWSQTQLAGLGSLQLSDFALLGLTVNLLCCPRPWRNHKYGNWFLIVFWIFCIALIQGISQAGGLKIAYNLSIRYGLLWLIPIIVAELRPTQRRTLLVGMLACGAFVTGIQLYAYINRDPSFVVKMYYQFHNQRFYPTPETNVRELFAANTLPRLYPSGALLVQSLFVFVLVTFILSHRNDWSNWLRAVLFCLYSLFFISLRQRSSAISLGVALCFLSLCTSAGNRRLRLFLRAVGIGAAGIVGVVVYQGTTHISFFDQFADRFQNQSLIDTNRVADNSLAFRAILSSPLIGTAARDVEGLAIAGGSGSFGLDVNTFLSVALLGGVPLLTLILAAGWRHGKRGRLILARVACDNEAVASVISVVYMSCAAVLNFPQVFTLERDMLPMLLFAGMIESPIIRKLCH